MTWWPLVAPLVGTMIGGAISALTAWLLFKGQRKQKLMELRIETYAEWMAGTEDNFVAYALQRSDSRHSYRVPLCEKRLLLIERDAKARQLIQAVHDSIPEWGTEDHRELDLIAGGSPDWDWPPFRKAMNELTEHLRSGFGK